MLKLNLLWCGFRWWGRGVQILRQSNQELYLVLSAQRVLLSLLIAPNLTLWPVFALLKGYFRQSLLSHSRIFYST